LGEYVVIVTLPGTTERFTRSCSGVVTVGRSEDCAIRLPHPLVSRRHAEVARDEDGRFLIRDLGSRNGTVVNGQTLRDTCVLIEGDVSVQVGPYVLLLTPPATSDSETVLADSGQIRTRLTLDRGVRALLLDGEVVIEKLSVLEYRLLDALAAASPKLVENKALGNAIWGADQWDVYMLHNLIRRVRRKLEDIGAPADELIVTVPGVGYHLA